MSTISPIELKRLLESDPATALIDVRTPLEFDQVHVPSAKNLPLDSLAPKRLVENGQLSADDPVFILCHSGGRARKAADRFLAEGYENTIVVEGGTQAWLAANLPVIRGETNAISLERQVRIAAGSLVLTGVLLGWFVHRGFFGISGFVGAGLIIAGITDWCGMGLLLAKAPWNQRVKS